jgi:hypothetical protein
MLIARAMENIISSRLFIGAIHVAHYYSLLLPPTYFIILVITDFRTRPKDG